MAFSDIFIENVEEISTEHLLDETNKCSPLYYVAAVIYSDQYNSDYTMSYILGAGDTTTDTTTGNKFYNRAVQGSNYLFYRVFSANSTEEVHVHCICNIKFLTSHRMKYLQLPAFNKVS